MTDERLVSIYEQVDQLAKIVDILIYNIIGIETIIYDELVSRGIKNEEDNDDENDEDEEDNIITYKDVKNKKEKITEHDIALFKKFLDVLPTYNGGEEAQK